MASGIASGDVMGIIGGAGKVAGNVGTVAGKVVGGNTGKKVEAASGIFGSIFKVFG